MKLGPDDPAPQPPPLPESEKPRSLQLRLRTRLLTMKKVLMGVALAWVGAAVILAQAGTQAPARAQSVAARPAQAQAPAAAPQVFTPRVQSVVNDTATHRAWLKRYCVGCHGNRNPLPANEPVNLESANLDDLTAQGAMWERVLRKLSVRAMPPQGMPHPKETEYAAFTTWLTSSLDRQWQGKATPGKYVMHRLNRTEYGNAIRDLLALDIDVDDLLPSDGANFGFDNIAASLRTSPLLLERYLLVAQRISTMAVGDKNTPPGSTEYGISREFTQLAHIDGLPFGTRGGLKVRHVFPADGFYKLYGRLVRGVEEGYAGVEGQEQPETFVVTVDGEEVYCAPRSAVRRTTRFRPRT